MPISIFTTRSDMKTKAQVIHCRMVEKLRPDELEAFKEAFDMFDRNMDGTISTKVGHKNGNCDNNLDHRRNMFVCPLFVFFG